MDTWIPQSRFWAFRCSLYLSNLKYWHFVSHLRLELHLLSVVELKQEVGGKTAVKALKKDLPFKSENFLFGTRFTFLTLNFEGGESLVDDLAAGEGGRLARGHDLQRKVSKGIKTSSLTWKTQASSCLPIAFSPMQNSVP